MFFILNYTVTEDYLEKRAPLRAEHLNLIKNYQESGKLQMAGAFDNSKLGAILIFKVEDTSEVEDFVKADPYYTQGLISSFSVNKWNCVADQNGMLI